MESQKMNQRAVFWWGERRCARASVGDSSAFTLEIGLSFGVYYHYFGTKLEKAARQDDRFQFCSEMVRAARIELASLAWKAGILAIIRRPLNILIIISQSEQTYYFCLAIIHRLFQYLRLSY